MAKKRAFGSIMELMDFFKETGRQGGKKAAKTMTAAERTERAKKAAAARWKKAAAKAAGASAKRAAKRKG
jgi:hypothetical protein